MTIASLPTISFEPSTSGDPKRFAEFFAGIGLMRLGLEQADWQIAFANDIDENKHAMYSGHFGTEDHFRLGDIHKIPIDEIPTVTLATASFPCNDLSLAGSRDGLAGKQSSALWGFTDILEKLGDRRPPIVLLENVIGFLSSHDGEDFKAALVELNRLGYDVDALIIDAARFVPQSRQRMFVIGTSRQVFESSFVAGPLHFFESDARPKALADFIFAHPNINWAIRDLPPLPSIGTTVSSIIQDLPEGSPERWSKERAEFLLDQMSDRHRKIADEMIAGSDITNGLVFRRVRYGRSMAELRTDGLAGCLRTPRGGSGRQILFQAGRGGYSVRLLTPRECARLMGAPDYGITVPSNQALFGFGDAVCVPVIRWIAQNYLERLVMHLDGR